MDVLFVSDTLARSLSMYENLLRRWGPVGARKVALRLQQLAAAPSLCEMRGLPGRCRELSGARAGQFAINVHDPQRLLFRPADHPPSRSRDAALDWALITAIVIVDIVDNC